MTVTYTHEVSSGQGFGNFWRLLGRWRGSLYKVVVPELIIYASLFGSISLFYRLWVVKDANRKEAFEKWARYCSDYGGMIPANLVLGFYVTVVVNRWWSQFLTIPWPDPTVALVANTLQGKDPTARLERRTIARYMNLSFVMTMVMISPQAKKRFPTMEHFVQLGLLFPHEKEILDRIHSQSDYPTYWIPISWAGNVATRARKEGRIDKDLAYINILTQLQTFKSGLGLLLSYDWITIPLLYTQVVTLAVYLYFSAALFGRQFINKEQGALDLFVPLFLFLEFFFYTGWLKVAETMVNPFGEDDDDFEVNWLIDRNITLCFMVVDEIGDEIPEMMQDQWWDEVFPRELPYTLAAKKFKVDNAFEGSANLRDISMDGSQTLFLPSEMEGRNGIGKPSSILRRRSTTLPGRQQSQFYEQGEGRSVGTGSGSSAAVEPRERPASEATMITIQPPKKQGKPGGNNGK